MRQLAVLLCLSFAVLLFSAGEAWSLPKCPGSYNQNTWTNCFGTLTFASGDKYVGEFRDGNFNGQGTYTTADGSKYVGEYRDGKWNGQGTFTFADGRVQEGVWKDNEFQYARKDPKIEDPEHRSAQNRTLCIDRYGDFYRRTGSSRGCFQGDFVCSDAGSEQLMHSNKQTKLLNKCRAEKREAKRPKQEGIASKRVKKGYYCKRPNGTIYFKEGLGGWCGPNKQITKAEYDRLKRKTVTASTAHRPRKPSFRCTKSRPCTNIQIGPINWG